MTTHRSRLIVVDAANVVGSKPDGWWRDRVGATRRLLEKLSKWKLSQEQSTEVCVVLEGAARSAVDKGTSPACDGLSVLRATGSGDDAIVGVVAAAADERNSRSITVVTADRELRDRVEALGADTVGPRWLLDAIDR